MQGKLSSWLHLDFICVFILWGIWAATWKYTYDLSLWTLCPGHFLLFDPVKISLTKHSWKLKLLGHVWKPGQVEWCHFTKNRYIHAADKGSLNFTAHWGHQPLWTVILDRIKRDKMLGLFQISWRYYQNLAAPPKAVLSFESKDCVLSLFGSVKKSSSFLFSLNICDKYLICDILVLGNITNRGAKKIFWL